MKVNELYDYSNGLGNVNIAFLTKGILPLAVMWDRVKIENDGFKFNHPEWMQWYSFNLAILNLSIHIKVYK